MVQYKLYYFNFRGYAEPARLFFNFIHFLEMPFEKMPVLKIDDFALPQSHAINRYLARQFGYAGKTPLEEATVDALADLMKDFFQEAGPFYMVQRDKMAPEELEQKKKEFFDPAAEKLFKYFEKYLKQSKSGFFVDSGVTWIDLFVADQLITIESIDAKSLDGHPEMLKLRDQVLAIPEIKEWIAKRPQTPF
ncbi:hypothetical protein WR25_22598 [Diploscapter pachys]|uniref:glutathione transferase n=1 Tax=Diploscapter pachys TaxID=2018661 RepID=A0A2A2JNY2_9BILA|nr:hypothetical protein WR25_22598 [Diploscapter pachys]